MELPSTDSASIEVFMAKVASELNQTFPPPSSVFSFGSTLPHLIPKMNSLVLCGVKRGMAGFPAPLFLTSGDIAVAVDANYQPAILIRVLSRTAVPFHSVTSKFVFEEGHPEMTIEYWREWHQKFWERKLGHDGQPFGDGEGKEVLNMIFKVIYPISKPLSTDSGAVEAFLELVERCLGLKVACDQVKGLFQFEDGLSYVSKQLNSQAVKGVKTAMMEFPAPKPPNYSVGDYLIGLGQFGEPYLLIQATALEERTFDKVEEGFALAEGMGNYEEWRSSYMYSWKEKKDHDGSLFGDGLGKAVLCKRFVTLWPNLEEEFP
jgi:uncharacterized protein YhfF